MKSVTRTELIVKARDYKVIYGNRLANHLPMALIALDKMDASEHQINLFFRNYIEKLEILGSLDGVIASDPLKTLGKREYFKDHLTFFQEQLAEHGMENVLKKYLPLLIPGLCASAFHAIIRLAYAVEINDKEDVAFALAYWSTEFQLLGNLGTPSDIEPLTALNDLAGLTRNHEFAPGIIADRMAEISELKAFQQKNLQPVQLDLRIIASLAIRAYLYTDNFTLLHGVTACFAFRILLPYIQQLESALAYLWQAFMIAFLSTKEDISGAGEMQIEAVEEWEAIFTKARASLDDHVIKMVYTCWSEYKYYGDAAYITAAEQVVRWDDR